MTYAYQRYDWVPYVADGLPGERTQEGDKWTITAKLKPGLTWSDGEAFTAKDIAFTLNTVKKLKLAGGWPSAMGSLESAEAVDDVTVKYIYAAEPGLAEWEFGTALLPILPEHFWQPFVDEAAPGITALTPPAADAPQEEVDKYNEDLLNAQQVLYSVQVDSSQPVFGPFTFSQWQSGAFAQNDARTDFAFTGTKVTEYSNGGYQEVDSAGKEYKTGDASGDVTLDLTVGPYVPNVIYNVYGDQNAAVLALEKGDIDYIFSPLSYPSGLKAQIASMEGVTVETNPQNGWRYLAFNIRKPNSAMSHLAFRQAVATLIDREFITDTILQGAVLPVFSLVPAANAAWYNPDVPKFGYNDDGTGQARADRINAAIALLEADGFTFEGGVKPSVTGEGARNQQVTTGGTLLMPDGTPVPELRMLAPTAGYDSTRSTAAIWIESWLNEFGIPTKADLIAFNSILDTALSGPNDTWDMYILGYGLTLFPSYLRDFLHSTGSDNPGLNDPELDALLDEFQSTTDLNEAYRLAKEIQAKGAEQNSFITLFTNPIADVHRTTVNWPYTKNLDGIQSTGAGSGLLDIVQLSTNQ
jgi:ABC-type transport system substrate-binding protein